MQHLQATTQYQGRTTAKKNRAEERKRLIEENAPMVRYIAGRIAIRIPKHVDVFDLESAGLIGLIDAIDRFDPSRGIKLQTYAEFRVRGAILDELRARDWLPRSVRDKYSNLKATYSHLEGKLGRSATDEEVAGYMGINLEEFHSILNDVNSGAVINLGDVGLNDEDAGRAHNLFVDNSIPDVSHSASENEIRELLARAIDSLPEKERLVIALYYYEELTLKEIGEVLGVSESRVCQINTKAVSRLKGRMSASL